MKLEEKVTFSRQTVNPLFTVALNTFSSERYNSGFYHQSLSMTTHFKAYMPNVNNKMQNSKHTLYKKTAS